MDSEYKIAFVSASPEDITLNVTVIDSAGLETEKLVVINISEPLTGIEMPGGVPVINVDPLIEVPTSHDAVISWDAPTENTDGSQLTDLAGFSIRYGTNPDILDSIIDIHDKDASAYTIEGLEIDDTYFFCVGAYTSNDIESDCSGTVSLVL